MCNVIAVYLILTEFAQCHVRDHLEDGTPESGLVPSAVDTDITELQQKHISSLPPPPAVSSQRTLLVLLCLNFLNGNYDEKHLLRKTIQKLNKRVRGRKKNNNNNKQMDK